MTYRKICLTLGCRKYVNKRSNRLCTFHLEKRDDLMLRGGLTKGEFRYKTLKLRTKRLQDNRKAMTKAVNDHCWLCGRRKSGGPNGGHKRDCPWNPVKVKKIEREIEVRYSGPEIKPSATKVWGEKERRKRELNRFRCSRGHDFITNMPRETAFCVERGCRDTSLTHVEIVQPVATETLVTFRSPLIEGKCSKCDTTAQLHSGDCCLRCYNRLKKQESRKKLSQSYELNQGKAGADNGSGDVLGSSGRDSVGMPGVAGNGTGDAADQGAADQQPAQSAEAA